MPSACRPERAHSFNVPLLAHRGPSADPEVWFPVEKPDIPNQRVESPLMTHTGHGPVDCPVRLVSLSGILSPASCDNPAMPVAQRQQAGRGSSQASLQRYRPTTLAYLQKAGIVHRLQREEALMLTKLTRRDAPKAAVSATTPKAST